jgi:signal transduction histidine kinase
MSFLAHRLHTCIAAGILCISIATVFCSSAWAAEPKRVLVLHSFGPGAKPWTDYARAIRLELSRQSPSPLNLYEYSLVGTRASEGNSEGPFAEYLRALFGNDAPDLILSIGAPAAGFVQRHRQKLFPDAPMLLTVVDQRRVQYSVLTDNDTVAAVSIDYLAAFENILRILPETKVVAVVTGSSPIEKYWKQEIASGTKSLADRLTLKWYDHLSFEDILKDAASLPPRSAIFWELMIIDAAGVVHEEGRALSQLYSVANAPIFSYTDAFFGREIVGGPHVPVDEAGKQVAEVAIRILGGEKAGDIKVSPVGMGVPKYDWRELQRWGIDESRLPPGSEIHYRPPSPWKLYQWYLVGIGVAILLQALIIHWLLYERRRRRLSEARTRESLAELAHVNRMATAGELSASIAHEVAQPLAGIVASANAGMRWLSSATPDLDRARSALAHIAGAGRRANEVVRSVRTIFDKQNQAHKPITVSNLVFRTLVLIRPELEKHQIGLETGLSTQLPHVMGDAVQLQQVFLNLFTNSIDSMASIEGRPRILRVKADSSRDGEILISIEDTGHGFNPDVADRLFEPLFTTKAQGMGVGLSICRSIIRAHGGRIWASSDGKSGATFQITLPIATSTQGGVSAQVEDHWRGAVAGSMQVK